MFSACFCETHILYGCGCACLCVYWCVRLTDSYRCSVWRRSVITDWSISQPSLLEPVSDTALNIPSMFRGQFPKHYCSIMPLDISATLWPLLLPQWCYIYSCSALILAFFLLHSVIAHWPLTFDAEFSFVIMSGTAHWFDLARLPHAQIASLGNRGMKKWSHFSHSAALLCAFPLLPCYDSLKVKL